MDDFGLESLKQTQRNDLLEIMDDRYGQKSTSVCSQLPTTKWHASIGDATLAGDILDRLMHNSHRIQLKGESMRKTMNHLTQNDEVVYKRKFENTLEHQRSFIIGMSVHFQRNI